MSSCRVLLVVLLASMYSCLKPYEPPTHESLLIWTDTNIEAAEQFRLSAGDLDIGVLNNWEGGHGCDSSGYLEYQLPIAEKVTFKLHSQGGNVTDLATIELYPGGSGANIKRHNNTLVNMDGDSYNGCTLLQLSW